MLASVLTLLAFSSFGVAMNSFFLRPGGVRPGMKLIQLLGPPLAILDFITVSTTATDGSVSQVSATLMLAGAVALFFWTWNTVRRSVRLPIAFSERCPEKLILSGPYAYCRHPFYASYVCAWMATALYCSSLLLACLACGFICIYAAAIRQEERLLMNGVLADAYTGYRTRVGLFSPRILRPDQRARLLVQGTVLLFAVFGAGVILLRRVVSLGEARHRSRQLGVRFNNWACQWALRRLNLTVSMQPLVLTKGPTLMTANHVSWADAMVLGSTQPLVFTASQRFNQGLIGIILRSFGTVFVAQGLNGIDPAVAEIGEMLTDGCSVVVFPEGHITGGDRVDRFCPALLQAALEAGVAVLPVAIRYRTEGGEASRQFMWVDEAPMSTKVEHAVATQAAVRAEVIAGQPLSPWFATRQQLASEAQSAVAALLSLPANLEIADTSVDLIRFRGHLPKGGYDVQTDGRHPQAPAAPAIR